MLAFLILVVLLGCKKGKVDPQPAQEYVDTFYFKGKINGELVNWTVYESYDQNTGFRTGVSWGADDLSDRCNGGYCYYAVAYTTIYGRDTSAMPQINIGYSNALHSGSREEMCALFAPGPKNYGRYRSSAQLLDSSKNGINVYYIDKSGKPWSCLTGDQEGSSFESVALSDVPHRMHMPRYQKTWKARFSCRLYDDRGNFIRIEDGEMYGPLLPR